MFAAAYSAFYFIIQDLVNLEEVPSNTTVFEIFLIALRNVLYISTSRFFPGTLTLQNLYFSLKKPQPKQQATTMTATKTFLDMSQPLSSRLHDTQPLQTFSRKSKYNFHGRCELPSSPGSTNSNAVTHSITHHFHM